MKQPLQQRLAAVRQPLQQWQRAVSGWNFFLAGKAGGQLGRVRTWLVPRATRSVRCTRSGFGAAQQMGSIQFAAAAAKYCQRPGMGRL